MPVEVTRVRVGLLTSTIGLKVFDPVISDPAKSEVFAVESALAGLGTVHGGSVHLPVHRQPRWVRSGCLAEPAPVLLHVRRLVVSHEAEVERIEGAFADTAKARREGDRIRARRIQ